MNGRVIVRRNPRLHPEEAEPDSVIAVRVDRELRDVLLETKPGIYFSTDHWRRSPSVLVRLAAIEADELRDLLEDAWSARVPRRVQQQRESSV